MREVILAKSAGFCFGVERAVNMVYDQINKELDGNIPIYTYGPIIHNEEVINDLASKGVRLINSPSELEGICPGVMVIRSHGISRAEYELIEGKGHRIVDTTCPFVRKIHQVVDKMSIDGRQIIIIGDENHSEVQGIMGWCNNKPFVIDSIDKAANIIQNIKENDIIVAQTTFNGNKFKELVEFFREKYYNINVYNTICNATCTRQEETSKLASTVDAMIVIGGKHSSNTQKLYEISKRQCANTYYIQTLVDLDLTAIESAKRVGITAGASTPNYIIKEVQEACQN